METPNLDEMLATPRHDDGCSAGIDKKYRCKCNDERHLQDARAELQSLKDKILSLDCSYNGWKNYQTWCVKLWIDNDQTMQEMFLEMAVAEPSDYALAHAIEDVFRNEAFPEIGGVYSDLLGAALFQVDWNAIARSLREEALEIKG